MKSFTLHLNKMKSDDPCLDLPTVEEIFLQAASLKKPLEVHVTTKIKGTHAIEYTVKGDSVAYEILHAIKLTEDQYYQIEDAISDSDKIKDIDDLTLREVAKGIVRLANGFNLDASDMT